MRINFKLVLSFIGLLLMLNGVFMFLCLPYSLIGIDLKPLFISGCINFAAGLILYLLCSSKTAKEVKKRDGYLIVSLGWIAVSLFGSIPYIISGSIPQFTNAFFESISGYTTTGASILADIEAVPKGILLWRSITQWIGGMGIIVLTVAILPLLGVGGMQLFVSEAPGISPDKLTPRINETAKRLWSVYVGFTLLEVVALKISGLTLYDAINHSLTTMATGGFSTKQASIAHFNSPAVEYIIVFFMFVAGTNFTLTFLALNGKLRKLFRNEEFKTYFIVIALASLLCFIGLLNAPNLDKVEGLFREALFQIVSIITTTGFATADYTLWPVPLTFLILILMFIGGSAGSTAGGVKIVRHLVLFKNGILELQRLLHPSAIISVRLNKKAIEEHITFNVLAFIIIYILIFAVGSAIVSATGLDFMTSIGAVATSLGNIGPGFGEVGPSGHFGNLPMSTKWILSFLMLLGRLELFTVLILFSKYFWSTS